MAIGSDDGLNRDAEHPEAKLLKLALELDGRLVAKGDVDSVGPLIDNSLQTMLVLTGKKVNLVSQAFGCLDGGDVKINENHVDALLLKRRKEPRLPHSCCRPWRLARRPRQATPVRPSTNSQDAASGPTATVPPLITTTSSAPSGLEPQQGAQAYKVAVRHPFTRLAVRYLLNAVCSCSHPLCPSSDCCSQVQH